MSVLHQNSGGIGKSIPSALQISLDPRDLSRVSGNLLGVGDGFPNTSLVLVEHGYIPGDQQISEASVQCVAIFHITISLPYWERIYINEIAQVYITLLWHSWLSSVYCSVE